MVELFFICSDVPSELYIEGRGFVFMIAVARSKVYGVVFYFIYISEASSTVQEVEMDTSFPSRRQLNICLLFILPNYLF